MSTIPKQNLLEYIIYILSSLSFWLGFCPLAIADTIMKKLQECTRRKTLEDEVRKNTRRFRNQEERIRILERILTANKEKKEIANSREGNCWDIGLYHALVVVPMQNEIVQISDSIAPYILKGSTFLSSLYHSFVTLEWKLRSTIHTL